MNPNRVLKISLCGAGGVGKTSLAKVFSGQQFNPRERLTVGVQHFFVKVHIGGSERTIAIWDIGGEHRFWLLAQAFLRGSAGVVYVFDITREETFLELDKWRRLVEKTLGDVPAVLVGNKADLQGMRLVYRDLAEEYARLHGMLGYFEVSAKDRFEVDKPFIVLLQKIISREREPA
uniref:GTP-binding protein n=1 Tax=Thermofilum pendens TaxID=2269 RepID=A0A7C3SNN4_THEPE